ncbi:MAG: hypothetical protein JNL21_39315 [Myxococcales bacterium]|nr:hypothetical protein [Myxococcales bacterium]
MPDLLPLERIAALRAELDLTDRPDDVLAREALTRSAWSAGLESLLAELADEVDRGKTTRAEAFADAYEEARAKLLGTAPADRAPRSKPEPIDPTAREPAAEVDVDATGMTDNRAVVQALKDRGLPFDSSAAPAPPPPPAPSEPKDQSGETVEVDATEMREKLRAMGIGVEASPPPSPTTTPATRGTEKLDLSEFQAKVRALQSLPMPVDRFAALQAELARSPDRAATLRARGVDPATWPDVLRAFGEAMKLHPNLREQYERLLHEAANR